ncbi:4-hydroxybenzoate octaprenyltransferase [Pararhodobacter sp. SW119]|uniref:4-hydroxybenzoate octaprenyltransferase n=1 Tax=Pararhodobacter sp. SW119 TaxID=2780075 RepID=UPI001ADF9E6A|nr:4-hydroxybenzoate octaprenyltransferase [Pararhodobacter sp. SW119]
MSGSDRRPEPGASPEGGDQATPDSAAEGVADSVHDTWLTRLTLPGWHPYLRLSRVERPIGTWLLLLPCWWGALLGGLAVPDLRGWLTVWILLGCAIGALLMRGAGCTWNDITDRDIDGRVARTRNRPLVARTVSVRQALAWMAAQMAVAFLILMTFNWAAIGLGILALVPVAIYPFAKRFTWWPQVFLGLAFNWGALLAWTAQTGALGLPAVFLYLSGIAWTLFYDTIYAHQDREDDALIGVKSTARLFGAHTDNWLRGFLVAAILLMSLAIIFALAPLADPLAMSLALAGAWAFGAHLNWQLGKLNIHDPDVCLTIFRSNRDAGLIVVLFFAAAFLL